MAPFDGDISVLPVGISQSIQELRVPARELVTGVVSFFGNGFLKGQRLGSEVGLRQALESSRRRFRTEIPPACAKILQIVRKRRLEIVRRVVFADIGDASI